jgi:hydroxymethylpyrimidine pyrophosphatase-like HAD family hydrolase
MIYVFDIDGTVCDNRCELKGDDYANSKSIPNRIKRINKLYDEGHTIIFQTARGMGRTKNNVIESYKQFYDFTFIQLTEWGVKFHSLFLGKPSGDVYIDDKGVCDEQFFTD